jgi:hypothetical protein
MERTHQLYHLAGLIASLRARGQATRVVVRNTERFGLIHLYFEQGCLVQVTGHAGSPVRNMEDLSTWHQGAVRIDRARPSPGILAASAELEPLLSQALDQLQRRGVVHPAPPAVSQRVPRGARPPAEDAAPLAARSPLGPRGALGAGGLPPLGAVGQELPPLPALADDMPAGPAVPARPSGSNQLTDPQWQLLALVVRQITVHAGQLLGIQVAEGLLRQALALTSAHSAFLGPLEVDTTGWLHARDPGFVTHFATFDAAEAVAVLLATYEALCAGLLGERDAQQLIASATAPFRTSLEQIGIAISEG